MRSKTASGAGASLHMPTLLRKTSREEGWQKQGEEIQKRESRAETHHGKKVDDLIHTILLLVQIFVVQTLGPSNHRVGLFLEGWEGRTEGQIWRERKGRRRQNEGASMVSVAGGTRGVE